MPRLLEVLLALVALIIASPVIVVTVVISAIETSSAGLFLQPRIGRYGKTFTIFKLKTMKDGRVTSAGKLFRKYKIDELPQLINVITGDMSIVGPRPDVAGYYDHLKGESRKILELRPGLTSLAAIKYRNEEELLAHQSDPKQHNDQVLFPDKVHMNLEYYYKRNFALDCKIIFKTVQSLIN
jgi:lipopolysaccharide/colanic/teichoic acid biosynthesis glycosyltransferase